MVKSKYKNFGNILVELDYISQYELDKILEKQRYSDKKFNELLIDSGYINEEELIQALKVQLNVARVDLSKYMIGNHLAQYIPEEIARRYQVIPLKMEGGILKVAMTDPSDLVSVDDIEMTTGLTIEPLIADCDQIEQAISKIYTLSEQDTAKVFQSLNNFTTIDEDLELEELEQVDEAPVVRLTNLLIEQAIQTRASDIHIEPQLDNVRVRYRIDGVLKDKLVIPKNSQAALISRLKIVFDLDITKHRIPQDGRANLNVKGREVDMRISTVPTIHGEKVAIRLLNKDNSLLNILNLGFGKENLGKFKKLIEKPFGIILVTGPTGSGKSTTLFAVLEYLKSAEKNIMTVEDPVEYQINGINQIQINSNNGLKFSRALRSILRQDPDILMIGEIRDKDTAQIAIRAALTGHLVLSTLHTNDSVSAILRLIEMGIPPYLVSSTVIGTIAQRLVRRLCKHCKTDYRPDIEEKSFMEINNNIKLYKSKGCHLCNGTGYNGRLAVQEILNMDQNIKKMILTEKSQEQIKNYALEKGLKTLEDDGINKVKRGLTSYQEIMRVIL